MSATTPNVTELLKYADLQMAAEAFLRDPKTQFLVNTNEALIDALVEGNNHASRFTQLQAKEFAKHWRVLDQKVNTSTGFSGTLFENLETGEVVMSFRSTEFIDDSARDNQATNTLEVAETGFAWGQLRDMKEWYETLKAPGGALGGKPFSVTGYSLGGHLATAFNLMYEGHAEKTVTFNGAGVGTFDPEATPLLDLVNTFADISRQDYSSRIQNADLRAAYIAVRNAARINQPPPINDLLVIHSFAIDASGILDSLAWKQANMILDGLARISDIREEVVRLDGLTSGDGGAPLDVPASDIAQMQLDYQMAVLTVSEHTDAAGIFAGLIRTYLGKVIRFGVLNQFDVQGATSPSAVANSQWHIGWDVPVFIEDQPLYRGGVIGSALLSSIQALGVKLLVDGYSTKDFGDAQSLVLLIDSLNVQDLLLRMLAKSQWMARVIRAESDDSNTISEDGLYLKSSGHRSASQPDRMLDLVEEAF